MSMLHDAGDGLLFSKLLEIRREKDWASDMVIASAAFIGLACCATATSLALKTRLLILHLHARSKGTNFGAVMPAPSLESSPERRPSIVHAETLTNITEKVAYVKFASYRHGCKPEWRRPDSCASPQGTWHP